MAWWAWAVLGLLAVAFVVAAYFFVGSGDKEWD